MGNTVDDFGYFDRFVKDLNGFTSLLVRRMPVTDYKDEMIVCFISRGEACLGSIYTLCKQHRVSDARILHRSLIDLYVHLSHTKESDNVEEYRYYTLHEKHRIANYALSHPDICGSLDPNVEAGARKLVRMYRELAEEQGEPTWVRPKAEKVLKGGVLRRVYKLGYDFLSATLVHPLWDTGNIDYFSLLGEREVSDRRGYEVMQNSVDIQMLLTGLSLDFYNESRDFRVNPMTVVCMDQMLKSMQEGTYGYAESLSAFLSVAHRGEFMVAR